VATDHGWMGTAKASSYLGIALRTLVQARRRRRAPGVSGRPRDPVRQADIDEWIESVRAQPGTLGHLYPYQDDGA
jgi:hypothetical protein